MLSFSLVRTYSTIREYTIESILSLLYWMKPDDLQKKECQTKYSWMCDMFCSRLEKWEKALVTKIELGRWLERS